jgi:hypothetical protein
LYWCSEQAIGLLGDFEYARKSTATTHHKVRTAGNRITSLELPVINRRQGTPFFMACEAIALRYLFYQHEVPPTTKRPKSRVLRRLNIQNKPASPDDPDTDGAVFAYNALHDLESVWWILIWVLFFNEDKAHPSPNRNDRQAGMDLFFNGEMQITTRFPLFKDYRQLQEVAQYMSPTFAPAFTILSNLSRNLNRAYQLAETNYPDIEPLAYENIHVLCVEALQSKGLLADLSKITLVPVKTLPQDTPQGTKRSCPSLAPGPQAKKSKYLISFLRELVWH